MTTETTATAPLTAAQKTYATALPAAELREFLGMSSTERDEAMAVMRWVGSAMVDQRESEASAAKKAVVAQRRSAGLAGGFWPRNPETAPVDVRELEALEAADDVAITQALAALDALLARASKHKDLQRRSRQLARIDRALADPESGYLRRLREARSATLALRHADVLDDDRVVRKGTPARVLAAEAGVGTRRIHALLADNQKYESDEMKDARAAVRAQREANTAAAKAGKEAQRRAALAEGSVWQARVLAGERVTEIAASEGVSWQVVANRIKAVKNAASATAV